MKQFTLTLHNRTQMVRDALWQVNEVISEEARKIKFEKMADSPYAFFRGSNHLYWEDFYNDWRFSLFGGRPETLTWINGDAHVYNFGAYANHYGTALFGLDDFDDSLVADYQYDLWRMAVSIVLDIRANGKFGFKKQKKALQYFAEAYLAEINSYAEDDARQEVILTKETAPEPVASFLAKVERKKSRGKMLKKWTIEHDDTRSFNLENPKLEALDTEAYKALEKAIEKYKETLTGDFSQWDADHFKVKDIARRLKSGTGSLGSDRFYVLLEGGEEHEEDDRILDVKEQGYPPLYYHMNEAEQKEYRETFAHEGERHALAFRALAEHPDKYLGWLAYQGKVFSVKEKSPFKEDFPTEKINKKKTLYRMASLWGELLATRHERASYGLGNDLYSLPKTLALLTQDKKKGFVKMTQEIGLQYADCVAQDYKSFLGLLRQP